MVAALQTGDREEVMPVEVAFTFLISVTASVVAYYLCKWLDGDDRSN